MYPILASGLVSAGSTLLERVVGPAAQNTINAIGNALSGTEAAKDSASAQPARSVGQSSLAQRLAAAGIQDVGALEDQLFQLRQGLLNDPRVKEFLGRFGAGEGLSLRMEEGSHFTLVSGDGRELTLDAGSELGQLAQRFHEYSSVNQVLREMPGSDIFRAADSVAASPGLNAFWQVRDSV
jgi:hypothetical protein